MPPIPEVLEALKLIEEIHRKKNDDYAASDNPFSNFDASEYGLRLFPSPRDGSFAWPIFTKLARLSNLLNSTKSPNNESIEDSFIDIATYILLWRADYLRRIKTRLEPVPGSQSTVCQFCKKPISDWYMATDGSIYCSTICAQYSGKLLKPR